MPASGRPQLGKRPGDIRRIKRVKAWKKAWKAAPGKGCAQHYAEQMVLLVVLRMMILMSLLQEAQQQLLLLLLMPMLVLSSQCADALIGVLQQTESANLVKKPL